MKKFLAICLVSLFLLPGCSLFDSNDGGDSSGGGGESETTLVEE